MALHDYKQRNNKDHKNAPEARRVAWNALFLSLQKEPGLLHLDLDL